MVYVGKVGDTAMQKHTQIYIMCTIEESQGNSYLGYTGTSQHSMWGITFYTPIIPSTSSTFLYSLPRLHSHSPASSRLLDSVLAFKRTVHDSDRYEYIHPLNNASAIRPTIPFLGILLLRGANDNVWAATQDTFPNRWNNYYSFDND